MKQEDMQITQLRNGKEPHIRNNYFGPVSFIETMQQSGQIWAICRTGGMDGSSLGAHIRYRSTMQSELGMTRFAFKIPEVYVSHHVGRHRETAGGNLMWHCTLNRTALSMLEPIVTSTGLYL